MVSRKYIADTLNAAQLPNMTKNFTQADVLAVSAMEAIGIAGAGAGLPAGGAGWGGAVVLGEG